MISLKSIADTMSKNDIILAYQGPMDKMILNDLLCLAESSLSVEKIEKKLKRKIFRILVESIQNTFKHQIKENGKVQKRDITAVMVRRAESYELILGNYIEASRAFSLKTKIDDINALSKEELVTRYQQTLSNNLRTKDGGSGLGLMDIVRKSGGKLNYLLDRVDEESSYFTLNVKINKDG